MLGIGALSFAAGAVTSAWIGALRPSRAQGTTPADATGAQPDLPGWLEEMLRAPSGELIRRAGFFERASRRHLSDPRVVAGFQRLLRVATSTASPESESAARCALRTLAKFGRFDLLQEWEQNQRGAPRFQDAVRAARRLRERERAGR